MAGSLDTWMRSAKYLPPILRDFHDQKDCFKAIHQIINVEGHGYAKGVDWVTGQCYVIDIFLWFMAKRGYTLQRSRAKLPFNDFHDDVSAARDQRNAAFAKMFAEQDASAHPTPRGGE